MGPGPVADDQDRGAPPAGAPDPGDRGPRGPLSGLGLGGGGPAPHGIGTPRARELLESTGISRDPPARAGRDRRGRSAHDDRARDAPVRKEADDLVPTRTG